MVGRRFVIKSSGELEEFDPNKLAITCLRVGVPFNGVNSLVSTISTQVRDGMNTSELRALVFAYMREKHPEAARSFKKKGEFFIRTTEERIEKWDRTRIADSLARETGIAPELADSISKKVEKELQSLNLDFVSGPLIREMVNVKLLEAGMESVRAKYTRLGLPVYDVQRLLDNVSPEVLIKTAGESVIEQYFFLTIPRHLTDAHFRGAYEIPNLTQFPMHPMSIQHDMEWFLKNGVMWNVHDKPAKRPETAINHCTRVFRAGKHFAIEQGINSLDSVLEKFDGDFSVFAKYLLYPINHEGINCCAILDLDTNFSAALMDAYLKGDTYGNPFLAPRPIFRISKKSDKGLVEKAHEYAKKCGATFVNGGSWVGTDMVLPRAGKLHSVTLNLPRVGYEAKGDDDLLNSIITERLEMIKELLMIKYNEMDQRLHNIKFLAQGSPPYFELKKSSLSIGIVGLNELAKAHTDKQLHEDGGEFGLGVVKLIREKIDGFSKEGDLNWVLSDTGPSTSIAEKDIIEFGREAVVWSGKDPQYTRSSHVPNVGISVDEKVKVEAKFHDIFNGGQAVVLSADEKDLAARTESVLKAGARAVQYLKLDGGQLR